MYSSTVNVSAWILILSKENLMKFKAFWLAQIIGNSLYPRGWWRFYGLRRFPRRG